ncbi:KpsF/GutQ family sugar-phosphate isomerase [Parvibium lacunae]|uniref:KpsF/GutQ family sugar-phosphate isomerase n=1 Tax=Parvibium lacunae TaxID=1888893 RepID=A0A368KZV3_9BURK|nr:KpsF/GutQ family sugar-phosphate isomerase [Parvibium lacunae]RCS56828.1 KpsF/GutQ family sugar-phosphate isomerase [Parvibium lacunae]
MNVVKNLISSASLEDAPLIALGREVLQIEAAAIDNLQRNLDAQFAQAVRTILACQGRVVVSGIGKSGHIGRKLAATLASTGTPAFFVHPAEASHGDLGMVTAQDVFIAISNSGESAELMAIMPLIKRMGATLIAMTGKPQSSMAQLATVHLNAAVEKEACPLNLAPTASTTAALALGDALAVALLSARGFREEDFARSHPGGALGRRLLTHVRDVMRTGEAMPVVSQSASLADALLEMSRKRMGMTAVVDAEQRVIGIFTDGDLRRVLATPVTTASEFHQLTIAAVMSANPRTIGPDLLADSAAQLMEQHHITQLLVVNPQGVLVGALNIHDLFHAKVV